MNCREFVDFLIDYLDQQLPGERVVLFEQHMRICTPCMKYLETYRLTIHLGRSACGCLDGNPSADTPDQAEFPEQLLQAILAARQRGTRDLPPGA